MQQAHKILLSLLWIEVSKKTKMRNKPNPTKTKNPMTIYLKALTSKILTQWDGKRWKFVFRQSEISSTVLNMWNLE